MRVCYDAGYVVDSLQILEIDNPQLPQIFVGAIAGLFFVLGFTCSCKSAL